MIQHRHDAQLGIFLISAAQCFTALILTSSATAQEIDERPNIVMVLADDLGYGALTPQLMPHCHQIAQAGSQLKLYAHQNCTPTRTALFTGRYPHRYGLNDVWPTPVEPGLPVSEKILSQHLQEAGYQCGIFGKWHLGWKDRAQWPTRRGFKEFIGCLGGHIHSYGTRQMGMPYADNTVGHDHHGAHDMQWNEVPLYSGEYSTKLFGDAAVRFIEQHANKDDPFFLYVPFNAPHSPYSAPREYVEAAQVIGGFDESLVDALTEYHGGVLGASRSDSVAYLNAARLLYAAMVMAVDDAVGSIYSTLQDHGVADNTIFVFCSDNGVSHAYNPETNSREAIGSSGPLRGQKGSPHEGGPRVVNFLIWPNKVSAGQVVASNVWIGDLTATFLNVGGATVPDNLDGSSILGALESDEQITRRFGSQRILPVVWRRKYTRNEYPDAAEYAEASLVFQSRKYIRRIYWNANGQQLSYLDEELYDLRRDIGETNNLVDSEIQAYARWLSQSRAMFDAFGGDSLLKELPQITRTNIWAEYEATTDFGIPDGTAILETSVTP